MARQTEDTRAARRSPIRLTSPLAVPIAVGVAAVVLGAKVAGDAFFGPPGGPG